MLLRFIRGLEAFVASARDGGQGSAVDSETVRRALERLTTLGRALRRLREQRP